jgi:hypothetical protein
MTGEYKPPRRAASETVWFGEAKRPKGQSVVKPFGVLAKMRTANDWRPHRDTRRVGVLGLFRTRRTSVDQSNQGSPSSREPFRCTSTARAIPANGERSRSEKSPASLEARSSPSTFGGLFAIVFAKQRLALVRQLCGAQTRAEENGVENRGREERAEGRSVGCGKACRIRRGLSARVRPIPDR